MNVLATVHRVLQTATWRREQARVFARERFQSFDQRAAADVLDCLVEQLSINFQQIHAHTDLAKDLGADEDEPEWIATWFRDERGACISPDQVAEARTVGGLVMLITRAYHEDAAWRNSTVAEAIGLPHGRRPQSQD